MAELFGIAPQNITLHLKNIYSEREVDEKATCKDFLQVQKEGRRSIKRNLSYYSLEAIIAVDYRINSERGTQFRQGAIGILKSYIHKGYVLDSNRMKYGSRFSTRYFDELYEEIKDIRSSERMLYQSLPISTLLRSIIRRRHLNRSNVFLLLFKINSSHL